MISNPDDHGLVDEDLRAEWFKNDAEVAGLIKTYGCWTPRLDQLAHAQAELAVKQWSRNLWRQARPWVIAGVIAIVVLVASVMAAKYWGS